MLVSSVPLSEIRPVLLRGSAVLPDIHRHTDTHSEASGLEFRSAPPHAAAHAVAAPHLRVELAAAARVTRCQLQEVV